MLFRIFDSSGKFLQYISLCPANLKDNTKALSTLKSRSATFKNVTRCSCNLEYYVNAPIRLDCLGRYELKLFFVEEIISKKRQVEIDAYNKNIQTSHWSTDYNISPRYVFSTGAGGGAGMTYTTLTANSYYTRA